ISGRRHPADHPALRHASAQSALHRDHTGQEIGGSGGAAQSLGDCGQEPRLAPAVVEAAGMVAGGGIPRGNAASMKHEIHLTTDPLRSATQATGTLSFAVAVFSASRTVFAGVKLSFFEAAMVSSSPVTGLRP